MTSTQTSRITVHASVLPGRYSVRYGTPSSFEYLGSVQLSGQRWTATTADGVKATRKLRKDAVAFLVAASRVAK